MADDNQKWTEQDAKKYLEAIGPDSTAGRIFRQESLKEKDLIIDVKEETVNDGKKKMHTFTINGVPSLWYGARGDDAMESQEFRLPAGEHTLIFTERATDELVKGNQDLKLYYAGLLDRRPQDSSYSAEFKFSPETLKSLDSRNLQLNEKEYTQFTTTPYSSLSFGGEGKVTLHPETPREEHENDPTHRAPKVHLPHNTTAVTLGSQPPVDMEKENPEQQLRNALEAEQKKAVPAKQVSLNDINVEQLLEAERQAGYSESKVANAQSTTGSRVLGG